MFKNGQTCLEKFAVEARKIHLQRNEWGNPKLPPTVNKTEYTKVLVDAEYAVQTDFKVD
jgi:hypothetical protein|nr:MAG TPA: hypothetical protein [Bacteriophage sp.]